MDERELSELLRDAAADAPPPSFDQQDVVRESDRLRRRRNSVIKGSAIGVALLAGATGLSVALWTGTNSAEQTNAGDSAAAGGNENAAPYELPSRGDHAVPPTERGLQESSSPESRKQGRTPGEDAGPAGPGSTSSGCEQADRELAAALAGELPAAANVDAEDAVPVDYACPPGSRGAAFELTSGTVSVLLVPTPVGVTAQGAADDAQADAPTDDGRTVLVVSQPDLSGGPAPYAEDLDEWAGEVAAGY